MVSVAKEDPTEQAAQYEQMFDLKNCEGFMTGGLEMLLKQPSIDGEAENEQTLCEAITGTPTAKIFNFALGKRLVPPGQIGLVSHDGKIEAVPSGRYALSTISRTQWLGPVDMTFQEPLVEGPLTVVRVPKGRVGLARHGGTMLFLAPGLHIHNDVLFQFEKFEDLNNTELHHGPLHVVRVRRGEYCKVWVVGAAGAQEARLLKEGCHVVDSNLFSVEGRSDVSDEHVSHGALHIIQVPKGHAAKVTKDNVPMLLGEGPHYINCTNFSYSGLCSLADSVIKHGTITVVRVNRGEIGLAWEDNVPVFLQEPGIYNFDSAGFQLVQKTPASKKIIELGTRKIVTVNSGEVGLSYDHGELKVLHPGRHEIDDAAFVVDGFLSTQQTSVHLVDPSKPVAAKDKDLLVCETKDFVKVGIRADVFYSIKDAEKAVKSVGKDKLERLLLETSLATVTNIMRSTTLNEIAQSKQPSAVSEKAHQEKIKNAQAMGEKSAPLFFDKAHDEFLSKLHDDFLEKYGIDITNIRIESFKIMDEQLASNISKQALTTAQTESQLANLAGQTEIVTKEQQREAALKQIAAESQATALRTSTEAKNQAMISEAEAQAKAAQTKVETAAKADAAAVVERARAEAEAIRLKGQAEAEAFELKATAEAKRAKQLADTPLGAQLSLLGVYAEMAAASNAGVEKVVYSDLQNNNLGLLAMPSLQNFSRDMALLQTFGQEGVASSNKK